MNQKVKDIQCGQLHVMLIQKEKKAKRKDGWLLYPSMAVTVAAIAVVGFSGILFTPVGMAVGTICLVWIGFCAVANAKATRWGAK